MITVLVVDDQELYRRAMVEVVQATDGFELVGEADSGDRALRAAAELSPDVVIVDKRMPGMDGYDTARRLREAHPALVVLIA
jgi:DNA-binding NarL/FixJ family response regulator